MAKNEKTLTVGTKLYHFGYGPLTIVSFGEADGKTYLYAKIVDWAGVPYRFQKNIETLGLTQRRREVFEQLKSEPFPLVIFDKRTVGHWVFLEEALVLHEDFSFVLDGAYPGKLNPYTVDLVHKQYRDGYGKRGTVLGESGLTVDADGVVIGESEITVDADGVVHYESGITVDNNAATGESGITVDADSTTHESGITEDKPKSKKH